MQTSLSCVESAPRTWPSAASGDRALLDGETAGALATLWQPESQALPSSDGCGRAVRVLGAPDVWSEEESAFVAKDVPVDAGVWNPPNPRNAFSCPFETLGNGQSDSVEVGHQPGSTGCHGCVVYRTNSNKLVFSGTFAVGWAEISSSPALRAHGIDSTIYTLVDTSAALLAPTGEVLYELGDALHVNQVSSFELTSAAPASLEDVELVLEYVVEKAGQSYSIAQTVPLIDLQ
jgi:hypothetical protein